MYSPLPHGERGTAAQQQALSQIFYRRRRGTSLRNFAAAIGGSRDVRSAQL
jgi:hypothetical protein